MRFQFEYTLCPEDFIALNKLLNQIVSPKRSKIMKGVFALLGVLTAGLGVTYLQQAQYASAVFLILVGAFFFYRMYTFGKLGKRQAARLAAGSTDARCLVLDEEGIHMRDSSGDVLRPYTDVQDLVYVDERYFLVFDRQRIQLLALSALTEGDPEALRPFLEEKLGRETNELV